MAFVQSIAVIAIVVLPACKREQVADDEPRVIASASVPQPAPAAPPSLRLLPVTRADLLGAVAAAADATAAGKALPEANRQLASRTFELHLPFGCNAGLDSSFDAGRAVLRVTARPERWGKDSPVGKAAGAQPVDAIEGFWIDRPWTTADTCPPEAASAPSKPSEPVVAPQTVAIAQFFAPEASRTAQRKDRPYTYTGKVKPGDDVPEAIRLRLSGRITGFSDGQPVHCVQANPTERPTCVVAVELTGVAFEAGTSAEVLADWNY